MSDTDDTDSLLLIPPSVFVDSVERDLELNSFRLEVVGNLIDQVSDLENRISFIESVNSPSQNNSLVELKISNSMVFNEFDSIGNVSLAHEELQSRDNLVSPSCFLNTCEINSNTESCLDLNHRENGMSKSKDAFLKEIDVYLNNISLRNSRGEGESQNTSDSSEASPGKESGCIMTEESPFKTSSFKRLDLPEVDRLLKEMENTQMEIENKLRMREVEYGLGSKKVLSNVSYRRSFPPVDNFHERNSAPLPAPYTSHDFEKSKTLDDVALRRDAYLVGSSHNSDSDDARKNNTSGPTLRSKDLKTSTSFDSKRYFSPRRKLFHSDHSPLRKQASGQSSSSVAPASLASDLHKRDYFSNYAAGDYNQNPVRGPDGQRGNQAFAHNRNDLLSLAELWKSEKDLTEEDSKKLRQKLEEERIRRIHLEETIQDLQKRVLEEQEKLAVAVKVDEGKDKAITQISSAWKQMVNHWKEIEADRHAMSQAIIKEKSILKQKEDDTNKKVERWEKEVSQALDLAAGYKGKFEMLESELSSTIAGNNEKTKDFEKKLKTLEEELQQLYEERKMLTDKLNVTQEEHDKEKKLVELAQKELSSIQEMLKNTDDELTIVKEQRDLLSTSLKDEKGKCAILEQQKNTLQASLEESKIRVVELEDTIKNSIANFEKTKAELRGVYQSQLDAFVKEKLEEFQSQFDKAQASMKAELSDARRLAQERAAAQQQSLANSHALEIRRIEATYKEEIRSLEKKLVESERRREKLESGKKEIAHRLHGVMEAQWQQALSIITSEISVRQGDHKAVRNRIEEPTEKMFKEESKDLDSTFDEPPYSKEVNEIRSEPNEQGTLLKYIQMLLDKQPGKPIDSASSGLWPDVTPNDTFDESLGEQKWNQIIANAGLTSKSEQETLRPYPPNQRKPPWK